MRNLNEKNLNRLFSSIEITSIREIDPENSEQLSQLRSRQTNIAKGDADSMKEFLYQNPPSTLPIMIEDDFAEPHYYNYLRKELDAAGFQDVKTKMYVFDATITPTNKDLEPLTFPALITTSFEYKGVKYGGPLCAGLQTSLITAQSCMEEQYSRDLIPEKFSKFYGKEDQMSLITGLLDQVFNAEVFDRFIGGLPNRAGTRYMIKDMDSFFKSPTSHLLHGGNLWDTKNQSLVDNYIRPDDRREKPDNPVRGVAFQVLPDAWEEKDEKGQYYYAEEQRNSMHSEGGSRSFSKEFIFYTFQNKGESEEKFTDHLRFLASDDRISGLLVLMRRSVPRFKNSNPEKSHDRGFDFDTHMDFMQQLIQGGVERGV